MKKLIVFLVLLAVLMLPAVTQAAIRKGPYLMYNGNNTQMEVLWQLDAAQTCTLEWGVDTGYGSNAVSNEYGDDHQHRINISGLSPGTKYYYCVTDGSSMYTGSFRTAPAESATAVKLFAWGDSRSRPASMDAVTAKMVSTYTTDTDFQTIALHSGDICQDNSEAAWDNEFFNRDYANNLELQANVPQAFAWGNHEGAGTVWNKYYPYPFVDGYYWSFDYGPVHVVVIDQHSAYTTGSTQHNWLVNDLENTSKRWKIAVYHYPGWTTTWGHSNNTTVQNHLQPVFVEYNVLLTIAGHNHNYTHCDVDGIHHITSGGGGAPLYKGELTDPYVVATARALHHCEIDIDGNVLNFTAISGKDGSVLDTFQIVGETDVTPPTPSPMTWATEPYAIGAHSIAMEAATATDDEFGVEYKFTCTAGGGNNSGWQTDTSYTDTGLPGGIEYTYTVTARDTSGNRNTTAPSTDESATTDAEDDPPSPSTMTWETEPYATGPYSIVMVATTATDLSGVQYKFNDSGWQDSPTYEDTGLSPATEYTYTVTARDKSAAHNETAASGTASATTTKEDNLVLPANGGVLEYFTSEYGDGWVASDLTNEITNEAGWSSEDNPAPYQDFIYSVGNVANLDVAVIHGGTGEGSYYSKDVEVWTSFNGTSFTLRGSDTLLAQSNDSVAIDLGGIYAKKVMLRVTSGYRSDYWELAEFEVYGEIGESCTATDIHIESVACGEANCGGGKRSGQVTVTILDDCGDPVANALVSGDFADDFSESGDGVTDGNGQAIITSSGCIKKPKSPSYTFTVTNVTHDTLPYDPTDNVTDNGTIDVD